MLLAQGLRLYRLAAGYEQHALALKVGVTRQLIAKLEAGRISPRLDLARRLAAVLNRTVDEIFPPPPAAQARGARSHKHISV
jgi:putative transcriptional regulator